MLGLTGCVWVKLAQAGYRSWRQNSVKNGGRKARLMTDLYAKDDVKTKENLLEKHMIG